MCIRDRVGSHIEGRFLNIVARSSVRKNLEHCFQQAKIDIADQLIAPLVTANAVLTESERRSGCALIDFGADTTTISVYKNNILRFLTDVYKRQRQRSRSKVDGRSPEHSS